MSKQAVSDQAVSGQDGPRTLAIDVGGTRLKAGLLGPEGALIGERARVDTPHPSPPDAVVPLLAELAAELPGFDRISVGFPGVVHDGVVRTAPNLGTPTWAGYDLAGALRLRLGKPVRVLNDASVQGLGVIAGHGLECVITLGTGFGFALYQDGKLLPHLELSQHPARKDMTYDEYLGTAALKSVGLAKWQSRVRRVIKQLEILINYDTLLIGGGNAKHVALDLPSNVRLADNAAGILGGIRLWDEMQDAAFEATRSS
jgi:polyphosphate glucokinase